MIPVRIAVKGFLCYRDQQALTFDSESIRLWMLAGLNGSGKSAVFDGVTFALFGGHRAGIDPRYSQELIHKDCGEALVEFDFRQDGHTYRAKRTIRRKAQGGSTSTQQLSEFTGPGGEDGDGKWEAVPDAGNKKGFDGWVREHIGLNFETFTSSVLLMQGRAEKLLSSAPKDRFEVLAGIVDLERYQRLFERADGKRARLKQDVELVQVRLNELPEVKPEELQEAQERIEKAEERLSQAQAEADRWQRLEVQAEQWGALQTRLGDARKQASQARSLVSNADRIDADWARLRELRSVLPPLKTALEQRNALTVSREKSQRLADRHRGLNAQVGELSANRDQVNSEQQQNRRETEAVQENARSMADRLRHLSGLLVGLRMCDQQREELTRMEAELAALPPDLATAAEQHERELADLLEVGQALPLLRRFVTERAELIKSHEKLEMVTRDGKLHRENLDRWVPLLPERTAAFDAATVRRQKADEHWAGRTALLQEANRQFEQLSELGGARMCRLCGQPVSPTHFEEERQRREASCRQLTTEVKQATEERHAAAEAVSAALAAKEEADQEHSKADAGRADCLRQFQELKVAIQRHTAECTNLVNGLPGIYQVKLALGTPREWAATTYPTKKELEALNKRNKGLPDVRHRLAMLQADLAQQSRLQAQVETARKTLATHEADLPADGAQLRQEHADLETADARSQEQLKQLQAQAKQQQARLDALDAQEKQLAQQLAECDAAARVEEFGRSEAEKSLERVRLGLPAAWQELALTVSAGQWQVWQAEQRGLEDADTETKAIDLATARVSLEALDARVRELEKEAEALPEEARCPLTEARQRTATARGHAQKRSAEVMEARTDAQMLHERTEKRRQLSEQHQQADGLHHRYRRLAELLGRNRLQLHLVRQAERGIVNYANAILDRLSGGQLSLRLRGDETGDGGVDQALQLEAFNRTASQSPIGVAFLSGSQRFRVAVSLALAIGQYASRQHRPIESVIIDEGFGCLDRHGRQVMIQELQNLRERMRCILLVSHQEEFADAFPDGYHFELVNGSTKVTPFQR